MRDHGMRGASRFATVATILVAGGLLVGAADSCFKRDAAIRERAEARRFERVYDALFTVILEGLTDSTSIDAASQEPVQQWLARSMRPRSPLDSSKAAEMTERVLERMVNDADDFRDWLGDELSDNNRKPEP